MIKFIAIFSILFATISTVGAAQFDSAFGRVPTVSAREAEAFAEASAAKTPEESLEILKKCAERDSAGAGTFFNLANLYAARGERADAEKYYRLSLQKLPSFFMAQKNLGFVISNSGDEEGAFAELRKALALSGGSDSDILLWLASYYGRRNDLSAALACCNQALVYDSKSASAQLAKARILLALGNLEDCCAQCTRILELDPKNTEALKTLLAARVKLKDWAGAISARTILESMGVRDCGVSGFELYYAAGLYSNAAKFAKNSDEASKAIYALISSQDAESALQMCGRLENCGSLRALALAALGRNAEACAEFAKYFSKGVASDCFAEISYANILAETGNFAESQKYFMLAACDSKTEIPALYGLLRTRVALGDVSGAIAAARKIISKKKDAELEKYILRLLELEKSRRA